VDSLTQVFGHRGSAGTHPENTMISFQHAVEVGANGIEFDVQRVKDGTIVIIHDETVDRTTTGKGWVKDFTYKGLQKLDASYKFKKQYGICKIPSLNELFEWSTNFPNLLLNIEFKNGIIEYNGMEEEVINMAEKYHLSNRIIFSSFNHYSIVKCKMLAPHIETAALFMEGLYQPWEYAKHVGAEAIHPYHPVAKPIIISQSQAANVAVRPFTVNNEKLMTVFINQKCAGIITDYPEKAKLLIKQFN
jgi:glycerophosphoryl diester phosphodiesterase